MHFCDVPISGASNIAGGAGRHRIPRQLMGRVREDMGRIRVSSLWTRADPRPRLRTLPPGERSVNGGAGWDRRRPLHRSRSHNPLPRPALCETGRRRSTWRLISALRSTCGRNTPGPAEVPPAPAIVLSDEAASLWEDNRLVIHIFVVRRRVHVVVAFGHYVLLSDILCDFSFYGGHFLSIYPVFDDTSYIARG